MKTRYALSAVAAVGLGLAVATAPLSAQETADPAELPKKVRLGTEMIVTANPLASEAGARILRRGGTAADAMVAAQTVLGLVEPQSSGLGGGAFVVYYDAATGKTTTFDGREKAPGNAMEDRFVRFTIDGGGGFSSAWQSGLSVGVPGTPRIMEVIHERYGHLRWEQLFRPAIALASHGFEITARTSEQVDGLLANNTSCVDRLFFRDPVAFEYFASSDGDTCAAKPAGTEITNEPYARTLKAIASHGADVFYKGEIAEAIARAVVNDRNVVGDMTTTDLANYEVIEREPVCLNYRGFDVCGMGPPSSGAIAVGQILGILENFDLGDDPLDPKAIHLFAQAGRLAFADRGLYVGDTDFVTVPVEGLLNKIYLASRAGMITDKDMGTAVAGVPEGVFDPSAPDPRTKDSGTSHISIVDRYGNALSMTTTIESSFGNGVMVHGFLLNNELTDFSFVPFDTETDLPVANRVQANKRPRSSMSPTIVFNRRGDVKLVTGSPGGSRIIGYTAQSIMNVVDFGLDPQQAINVPHYMSRNGRLDLEEPIPGVTLPYDAEALKKTLEDNFGYEGVGIVAQTSGLSVIKVNRKRLVGGADKRRDGTVDGR